MGIEPYLVASSVSGIVAQRLVRKICPKCKNAYEASSYEKKLLKVGELEPLLLHKGTGCAFCNNTGYSGRTGVYEIMEVTREHKELIMNNRNSEILKDLSIKNGMRTLDMSCRELVINGTTTMDELVKIAFLKD
jgi:type IV pilus assembly protein PilB